MRSLKRMLLFYVTLFLSSQLCAQEKWTLNECIAFAIKNNLQLRDSELDVKLAGMNYNQSKWNILPGINAGANAGMNYGRSVDPNTNGIINTSFFNNSYYLTASVDLFRGFMLQNQIRYQEFRKESTEKNKINITDDLAFAVMSAFFNVLYYEELLKIATEQKALSELSVKKTQVLVANGLKAQADLLEVIANFEKEELFCIQTSNNLASSWISLKKAMNLPTDQQITLDLLKEESDESVDILPDIHDLFIQHSTWSPLIKSYEYELQASRKNEDISKAGFSPSIRLQASYNTGFYETNKDANNHIINFREQIRNNSYQFLGASLSIPIFNKNAVRFDVTRSKLASEKALISLEVAKQTLFYEMEENYNELTFSWREFKQAEKQLDADIEAFQAAQKKYNLGMINVVELYIVKNRLANTTAQALHSKLTHAMKKRIIEFYKGKRFWE